jgi:acyl CoA:acetate/3-ketoacid CoA transferase alpha subunit
MFWVGNSILRCSCRHVDVESIPQDTLELMLRYGGGEIEMKVTQILVEEDVPLARKWGRS